MTEEPEEQVGKPEDFGALLGSARTDQTKRVLGLEEEQPPDTQDVEPEQTSEPDQPVEPATVERQEATIEVVARELGADPYVCKRLADYDQLKPDLSNARDLIADVVRAYPELAQAKPEPRPPSFDGGVRVPLEGASDPGAEHNQWLVDVIQQQRKGDGGWS